MLVVAPMVWMKVLNPVAIPGLKREGSCTDKCTCIGDALEGNLCVSCTNYKDWQACSTSQPIWLMAALQNSVSGLDATQTFHVQQHRTAIVRCDGADVGEDFTGWMASSCVVFSLMKPAERCSNNVST